MTNKLDCDVLACQVDSLRAALLKVLDTREKEAKATLSFRTAVDNFSLSQPELDAHQRAMTAASSAEKEARLLLATLKTPNAGNEATETAQPAQPERLRVTRR